MASDAVRRICSRSGSARGRSYLPLIATLGIFILLRQLHGAGSRPDGADEQHQRHARLRASPRGSTTISTASGSRASSSYVKHFWAPPGAPVWIGFLYVPDRDRSATVARVCRSRFGSSATSSAKSCVIIILFSIVPFIVPLPMMFLGLITGGLQAFIFVLLSIIYLQGAVAVEHDEDDARTRRAAAAHHAPAAA